MASLSEILSYVMPTLSTMLIFYLQRSQRKRDQALEKRLAAEEQTRREVAETEQAARDKLAEEVAVRAEKLAQQSEARSEARRQESLKALDTLRAVGGLALATARATRDGKCNGEMTAAIADYQKTDAELLCFLKAQATAHYARP